MKTWCRWASVWTALLVVLVLSGCSAEGTDRDVGTDSLKGELVVYIADFDDGSSEKQYFLRALGSEADERRLVFATDPDLGAGVGIEVKGVARADVFEVLGFELAGATSPGGSKSSAEALVSAPPLPVKSFAFVRVDIGGGINLSVADAQRKLFGTNAGDNSLKQYYLEASYGRQDINGQIFGPFNYTMTGCNYSALATALRPQITGTFNHYLWYFGSNNPDCSWAGLAQLGSPDRPARDSWYDASSGCVVLVQEPGHNFGMQHSSFLECGDQSFRDDPNVGCSHEEYGDSFDPMGGGCRHMNAWQKTYQGWHGGCNSVRVTSSGTFTLFPLETPCNGIQALQIRMPKDRPYNRPAGGGGGSGTDTLRYYYLELRTSTGFDTNITGAPTVLVHVADNYRASNQTGFHTWLLDMNPATSTKDGMRTAGSTFTDPAGGVSFTVDAISAAQATITVNIANGTGAPVCFDGTTLTPPGPSSCGGGGAGNGSPCSAGSACASGNCVDGVCCSSACTGACQACTAAKKGSGSNGTCGPIADGGDPDSECADQGAMSCGTDGWCNGAGACRRYASGTVCGAATCSNGTLTGSTCNGTGTCQQGSSSCGLYLCASGSACGTSCTSDANCVASAYCRTSDGTCQPDQGNGGACSSASQCTSGNCVDGFCCDSSCTGACRACSAVKKGSGSNGTCGNVSGGSDPDSECADDGAMSCDRDGWCDGSGACRLYPAGASCGTNTCTAGVQSGQSCDGFGSCNPSNVTQCAPYVCASASACGTTCTADTGCIASAWCETTATPRTCRADLGTGNACTRDSQCLSGFCADGFCCDARCDGLCRGCSSALTGGANGQCGPVLAGTDPGSECTDDGAASCDRNGLCNGSGACQLFANGTACGANTCSAGTQTGFACDGFGTCTPSSTADCAPYQCNGSTCGTSCTNDAGCFANHFCQGGTCRPDQENGGSCTSSNQCRSGECVDGVCCDSPCDRACQACSAAKKGSGADGVCGAIGAGADPDNECPDDGASSCGRDGMCSGSGACRVYAGGTACGMTTCSSGTQTGFACNGTGMCVAAQTSQCTPYVCNGTSCGTTCTSDTGCVTAAYCSGGANGQCKPDEPSGGTCTANSQCQSGFCVDGVCCSTECSGPCQACSAAKKGTGANGTCGPIAQGTDPDNDCAVDAPGTCQRTGDCNGTGACELYGLGTVCGAATCSGSTLSGQQCNGSGTCAAGQSASCAPYLCAGSNSCGTGCSTNADCMTGNFCIGGVCTQRKPNGGVCSVGTECESGFCVDGVCCNTACDGLCQACSAQDQETAQNGTCGPAKAGTDPHDDCADDGAQSCDRDGTCDGTGQCRNYPNGAPCGATTCVANSVTGQTCDGSGTCRSDSTVPCGAFLCTGGACTTVCTSFADCSDNAFCSNGRCDPKKPPGGSCNSPADCANGFCVDGVCCDTPCLGQCEACDVTNAVGTCTAVTGSPHGERIPCEAGTRSEPCAARACDGTTRDSCAGVAGSEVTCREPACDPMTGTATPAATCNGSGMCPASEPQQCGRFACKGTTCGSGPCASDSDCASGYRCDTANGECVPTSTICDVDGKTLRKPDGSTMDCSPFVCRGNACTTTCTADSECASGSSCKSGVCSSSTSSGFGLDLSGSDGWFCTLSDRRPGYGHGAWVLLAALGLLARRRIRAAR
jgi:hypothetical protein